MLPDTRLLLSRARSALHDVSAGADSGDKAKLGAVDSILVELMLRADSRFYVDHHLEGAALAGEGVALLAATGADDGSLALELQRHKPLDARLSVELLWNELVSLRTCLEQIVRALSNPQLRQQQQIGEYLSRLVDWENRYHVRHSQVTAAPGVAAKSDPFTQFNIQMYLEEKFSDWRNVSVRSVKVLPGGFAKSTILIDVCDDVHGERSMVIRAEQPPRFNFWEGDRVQNEFDVLQAVYRAGLPVPEPLWLETDLKYFGRPFLVSRKAEGQNMGSSIDAQANMAQEQIEDLIRNLVRIHATRLDPDSLLIRHSHLSRWAQHKTITEAISAWVEHWFVCVERKQLIPSPLTVRLMEWLRNNVPRVDEPPVFQHNDFGLHNCLFAGNRVSAILDWEYASFGDPAEDIALLSISLSALMDKQRVMALYRQFGGRPIDEYRLRYFDVLCSIKFVAPCANALKLIEENDSANIGLCKFGFEWSYPGVGDLNQKIALAEQAKSSGIP